MAGPFHFETADVVGRTAGSPDPRRNHVSRFAPVPVRGGPIILMGIDAEDGGPGAHGPISVYVSVLGSLLDAVTNGGTGVLVIGGGKSATDHVTRFWDDVGSGAAVPITYVNGAAAMEAQSLAGFAAIAVASSIFETPSGGLTDAENEALSDRQSAIAAFINAGGGLLAFSAYNLTRPYGFLDGVGNFTFNFPPQYNSITPTAEGLEVGITTALNVCCWHDEYIEFPDFLTILATNNATGKPAAIGGIKVFVPPTGPPSDPDPVDLEGCTPGYWSQNGIRRGEWPAPYEPGQLVSSIFSAGGYLGSATLLQALQGYAAQRTRRNTLDGASEILLRAATAAVLNEAKFGAAYAAVSVASIQHDVDHALASGDRAEILDLADLYDAWNNNYVLDADNKRISIGGSCPL